DNIYSGVGVDTVYGNGGSDSLHSNGQLDVLFGGGGNDHFFMSGQDAFASGGAGDDVFTSANVSPGPSRYVGGRGNDYFDLEDSQPDTVTGGAGDDTLFSLTKNDVSSVEVAP